MSYKNGMSAINLEKSRRVPRTEYSAHLHWKLVKEVTGIEVNSGSPESLKLKSSNAFRKAWNYDLVWSVLINREIFGEIRTKMGHVKYTSEGS